jgi:alpha-galactosidase
VSTTLHHEQVRYVHGLYRLWDTLLSRFETRDLLIDNCAGGGRRIDLETLSRSVPLWRTDAGCPSSESAQVMSMGISSFLPVSSGATCGAAGNGAIDALQPYVCPPSFCTQGWTQV